MTTDVSGQEKGGVQVAVVDTCFSYEEAFSRNIGLFTPEEQERLRGSHVAVAGLGGVGGVHVATLARTGIGTFTIADPDRFELVNMNRQYGARVDTIGRAKVEVMAEAIRGINPDAVVRAFHEPITADNVDAFMKDVDLVIDALDFFAMQARRLLFGTAHARGIWGITAGPHALSASLICFSPTGMTFDDYFDLNDEMSEEDQIVAFAVGGTPRPIHLAYLDLKEFFNLGERRGASAALACQLASGLAVAESAKILLGRGQVRAAPCYLQFDAYRQKLVRGRLLWANRGPLQRFKRRWLRRQRAVATNQGPTAPPTPRQTYG